MSRPEPGTKGVSEGIVQTLEEAISALEAATSAEVVVATAPRSGFYGDVDLLWGGLIGLGTLALILWSPWHFHPDFVLLNVLLVSLLGWFVSRKVSGFRRLLITRARREAQVEQAARLSFLEAGVDGTSGRTGILIYVSRLERRIALVLDRAVRERVPAEVVQSWRDHYGAATDLAGLVDSLPRLLLSMKEPLALHLGRRDDDIDELANQPLEVRG